VLRDRAHFLAEFVRRPFHTASITPSSQRLAEMMVVRAELAGAETVVELGPGTGAFTRLIVRDLGSRARLICIEINPVLAKTMAARFPRALVVNDSAENLARHLGAPGPKVDCVISGLPWVIMSGEDQRRLLEPAVLALRPGGTFTTFAYSHAAWLPAGRRFRAMLESHFSDVEVSPHVWRNLPPAFVYRCRK
jgi:phospholipid N-methyltransferase